MGSVCNFKSGGTALADGHVGHVVEGDGRSVHSHFHTLGGRGGAGLVAFAHRGRRHHAVGGGGIRTDFDACTIAVGDGGVALIPNVGEIAGV